MADDVVGHAVEIDVATINTTRGGIPTKGRHTIGDAQYHVLYSNWHVITCILIGITVGREAVGILQHHIGVMVVIAQVESKCLARACSDALGRGQVLSVNPYIHLDIAAHDRTIEGGRGDAKRQIARG